jgi:hypothetical protein
VQGPREGVSAISWKLGLGFLLVDRFGDPLTLSPGSRLAPLPSGARLYDGTARSIANLVACAIGMGFLGVFLTCSLVYVRLRNDEDEIPKDASGCRVRA